MKRLVTQFDDERTRATVATPTCCCCCCCVASIATSTAVTVLNVHELTGRTEMPWATRWWHELVACLVLPLAVLAGIAVGLLFSVVYKDGTVVAGLVAGYVAWAALPLLMYRRLGLGLWRSGAVAAITAVAGTVLFVVEFYVGAILVSEESTAGWYVLFLLVPFLAVPLLRKLMPIARHRRHS